MESVSSVLGPSNIITTQIYAKVIETKLSHDMGMIREKWMSGNKVAELNVKEA